MGQRFDCYRSFRALSAGRVPTFACRRHDRYPRRLTLRTDHVPAWRRLRTPELSAALRASLAVRAAVAAADGRQHLRSQPAPIARADDRRPTRDLLVAAGSDPNRVALALARRLLERPGQGQSLVAIGKAATAVALQAICLARGHLAVRGLDDLVVTARYRTRRRRTMIVFECHTERLTRRHRAASLHVAARTSLRHLANAVAEMVQDGSVPQLIARDERAISRAVKGVMNYRFTPSLTGDEAAPGGICLQVYG